MSLDTFSEHACRGILDNHDICSIAMCRLSDTDAPLKLHHTSALLLLYCIAGDMEIRLNADRYSFHKNVMMICRPDDTIELSPVSECVFVCAIYSQKFLSSQFHYNEDFYPCMSRLANRGYMQLDTDSSRKLETIATCLVDSQELEACSSWAKGSIASSMKALLCLALYWFESSERQASTADEYNACRGKEIFNNFVRLITENCITERKVHFYASQLCITPKYLSRIVHEKSGKTASRLIKEAVLREINYLLKNTTLSIKEISNAMNFPNASFFCKYFKNEFGISPNRYRES